MNLTEWKVEIEKARLMGEVAAIRELQPLVMDSDFEEALKMIQKIPALSVVAALIRIGAIKR